MPLPVLNTQPLKVADIIAGSYYDRNPKTIYNFIEINQVAPATFVTQWTYTVPSNRKGIVDSGTVATVRQIPATTQQDASSRLFINNGTVNAALVMCGNGSNVPSAKAINEVSTPIPMFAGYVLTGVSSDASTGGTMAFVISASVTEFDA